MKDGFIYCCETCDNYFTLENEEAFPDCPECGYDNTTVTGEKMKNGKVVVDNKEY